MPASTWWSSRTFDYGSAASTLAVPGRAAVIAMLYLYLGRRQLEVRS